MIVELWKDLRTESSKWNDSSEVGNTFTNGAGAFSPGSPKGHQGPLATQISATDC